MERISLTISNQLKNALDEWLDTHPETNRSKLIQRVMSTFLESEKEIPATSHVAMIISYVYNHREAKVVSKIIEKGHDHKAMHNHQQVQTSTHIHLDVDNCLECITFMGHYSHGLSKLNSLKGIRGIKSVKAIVFELDSYL